MKHLAIAGLVIALGSMLVAGCNKSGDGEPNGGATKKREVHKAPAGAQLKLAFVSNNASEFWKIATAGVRKYEKEAGVQVDVKLPPNGAVEEQNQILENLVSQGYNGIAISVIAPKDQVAEINRAARKTNLITHDSDAATSNRLVYIGTNNFEAGKVLGKEIAKLLPNGGKMACFVGSIAADNAKQRLEGIKAAIKGTKIEIIDVKTDETDRAKARSNVESMINAHPDLALLCGLWSYNGPAIAAAIDASGKKGKILAAVFDEEDLTLKGIEDGIISCTVVQKPFEFGYQSSKLLHALATKGDAALPKEDVIDTGVDVINAANVAQFKARLDAMKRGQ
jgi:ribose transport system substrate-binding protein